MKYIIASIVLVLAAAAGIYFGGYLLLIKPIIEICALIDAGTLTASALGIAAIKVLFAGTIGWIIFYIGAIIAAAIGDRY